MNRSIKPQFIQDSILQNSFQKSNDNQDSAERNFVEQYGISPANEDGTSGHKLAYVLDMRNEVNTNDGAPNDYQNQVSERSAPQSESAPVDIDPFDDNQTQDSAFLEMIRQSTIEQALSPEQDELMNMQELENDQVLMENQIKSGPSMSSFKNQESQASQFSVGNSYNRRHLRGGRPFKKLGSSGSKQRLRNRKSSKRSIQKSDGSRNSRSGSKKRLFRKPIPVSSEFSLTNTNTAKLWSNFEQSLAGSVLGNGPILLGQNIQKSKDKVQNLNKSSPLRNQQQTRQFAQVKWSPTRKQKTQIVSQSPDKYQAQEEDEDISLFQQGVQDALRKNKLRAQGKQKLRNSTRDKGTISISNKYSRYDQAIAMKEVSPSNIVRPKSQKSATGDLNEYFNIKQHSPFQVAMASPIPGPAGPFEFKSGVSRGETTNKIFKFENSNYMEGKRETAAFNPPYIDPFAEDEQDENQLLNKAMQALANANPDDKSRDAGSILQQRLFKNGLENPKQVTFRDKEKNNIQTVEDKEIYGHYYRSAQYLNTPPIIDQDQNSKAYQSHIPFPGDSKNKYNEVNQDQEMSGNQEFEQNGAKYINQGKQNYDEMKINQFQQKLQNSDLQQQITGRSVQDKSNGQTSNTASLGTDRIMSKVEKALEFRQRELELQSRTPVVSQNQRKKSPEELVDTVNRKYKAVFGQGDLVNIQQDVTQQDVTQLDIDDMMNYLRTGNIQRFVQKNQPLRNPSPVRLANIDIIPTQAELNRFKMIQSDQDPYRQVKKGRNKTQSPSPQRLNKQPLRFNQRRKSEPNSQYQQTKRVKFNLSSINSKTVTNLSNFKVNRKLGYSKSNSNFRSAQAQAMAALPMPKLKFETAKKTFPLVQQVSLQKKRNDPWSSIDRINENDKKISMPTGDPTKLLRGMFRDLKAQTRDRVAELKEEKIEVIPYSPFHFAEQWKQSQQENYDKTNIKIDYKKSQNIFSRIIAIHKQLKPVVLKKFDPVDVILDGDQRPILPASERKAIDDRIHNLQICEKLFQNIEFELVTSEIEIVQARLLNAFMLVKLWMKIDDFERVIRILSTNTKANLYIKDLLEKLSKEPNIAFNSVQNYVLYIYYYLGDAYMQTKSFKKASQVYYLVCKIYNRWKINNKHYELNQVEDGEDSMLEFGVDDYIRTKGRYAESIMRQGDIADAIEKFENTKRSIENEVVYENPMILVNISNQLGNCYLQFKQLDLALDNFEISLCLINKVENEKRHDELKEAINPLVVAKICLNIALIRQQLGFFEEAVFMHEKSLAYKSQMLPQLSDEIRDQNLLLAFAQQRISQFEEACRTLNRAFQIHKTHNGEYTYKSAQILSQLATAKLKSEHQGIRAAINDYEYACMILSRLESDGKMKKSQEPKKVATKLDKIYLQLIDLYLSSNQEHNWRQVTRMIEGRLEKVSNSQEYAYRMMNELANVHRKHEKLDASLIYYKKALLCMKRRHKNKYLEHWETAKIIINIATVCYLQMNLPDSLKYHYHAQEVLQRVLARQEMSQDQILNHKGEEDPQVDNELQDTYAEKGKIHMSTANLFRLMGEDDQARAQYRAALDAFELINDSNVYSQFENCVQGEFNIQVQKVTISQLMLEARHHLKSL